jgi:hypothetical protein
MQSPALLRPTSAYSTSALPVEIARNLVARMRAWAEAYAEYKEPLDDCIEELSWKAKLGPAAATEVERALARDSYTATTIITYLSCNAELYPAFSRILLSCVDAIEEIERQRVTGCPRERTRDVVFEAITQGYKTGPAIADATGLSGWRVRHALRRLHGLGLIRCVGCGAVSFEDGNRTRRWELVPSLELKAPRFAA